MPSAGDQLKPITVYAHATGPNPWKSIIVLEELGIPYETKMMQFPDLKKDPFEKLNPNGRVPTIEDPNTGIVLSESGAINEYLVDVYDKEGKIHYRNAPEKYLQSQWLYFQMSGQGPYYGQAAWFSNFHSEKLPSAIERYNNETIRVISVLDKALAGKEYLVGNKCTIADLSFVTWQAMLPFIHKDKYESLELEKKYPSWAAWHKKMMERPAVKKTMADKQAAMSAGK